MNRYFDKRQEFITSLLECLLELNEKNLLDSSEIIAHNRFAEFFDVFHKHKIVPPTVINNMNDMRDMREKISILSNDQNIKSIIETMIQTEYFTRLIPD